MSSLQILAFYAVLMLIAGLGIPVMAALSASLGTKIQSPALAASILFVVAGLISFSYLLLLEGLPKRGFLTAAPVYLYFGGVFVAVYVLSITWVAPKFGVGNAVAFVLLGQLISMAVIDHFGWLGAPQTTISMQRLLGLALMAVGVFLAVRRL